MILVAIAAGCLYLYQGTIVRARFEILDKDLVIEDGYLNGSLSFRCSRLNDKNNIEYADTVLQLRNIGDTRMMDLKPGDEFFLRYRESGFGPLKAQNRYLKFMKKELGILEEQIDYFMQLDGWGEFVVTGKADPIKQPQGK
jgi:hypothetical protein